MCETLSLEFPTKYEVNDSLLRKRAAIRKEYYKIVRITQDEGYPSGAYWYNKDGDWTSVYSEDRFRYKRCYRGKRSSYIKKMCNRKWRRSSKLNMLSSRAKSLNRKATEFWYEYD